MDDLRSRAEAARDEIAKVGMDSDHIAAPEVVRGLLTGEPVRPPETDPSIPAELDVPVWVAWSRVMGEVQFIAKNRRTEQGTRYNYRGVDDIMNAVAPALRKHGVIVMPSKVTPTFQVINTTKDKAMNYCRAVVEFTVIGPRGDTMPVQGEALGEAFDSGDKSGTKAASVAMRTFYTQALAIPTNRPAMDPEYGEQHEIAGPPRPDPAQYAAEILADATSVARLQQIKAELDADPRMGHATVEGLDGQPIELGRLVRRVGAARLKGAGQGGQEG